MTKNWYDEVKDFPPRNVKRFGLPAGGSLVGHYTQVSDLKIQGFCMMARLSLLAAGVGGYYSCRLWLHFFRCWSWALQIQPGQSEKI